PGYPVADGRSITLARKSVKGHANRFARTLEESSISLVLHTVWRFISPSPLPEQKPKTILVRRPRPAPEPAGKPPTATGEPMDQTTVAPDKALEQLIAVLREGFEGPQQRWSYFTDGGPEAGWFGM